MPEKPLEDTPLGREINSDPEGRGYATMNDTEVLSNIYLKNIPEDVEIVSGSDILEACDMVELGSLAAVDRETANVIFAMPSIQVKGSNTRATLLAIFAGKTKTLSNLQALQTHMIHRVEEARLGKVRIGHIQRVRSTTNAARA